MGRPRSKGPAAEQMRLAAEGRQIGREAAADLHEVLARLGERLAGDPTLTATALTVLLRDLVGEGRLDDDGRPVDPLRTVVGVLRRDRATAVQAMANASSLSDTDLAALLAMKRTRLGQIQAYRPAA